MSESTERQKAETSEAGNPYPPFDPSHRDHGPSERTRGMSTQFEEVESEANAAALADDDFVPPPANPDSLQSGMDEAIREDEGPSEPRP